MRSMRGRWLLLAILTLTATIGRSATAAEVHSPSGLRCSLTADGHGVRVCNLDARYGVLELTELDIDRPIVFEIGREERHLRRVYPSHTGSTLRLDATPSSEYVIYPADAYVDQVLQDTCGVHPAGLTMKAKLRALARAADLRRSGDARRARLALEALQVLLGIEFRATMEYPSTQGGDYRLYAGSEFRVKSAVSNRGTHRLTDLRFELMAPDEWNVRPDTASTLPALDSRASAISVCRVRAPERSSLRAPVSPLIAMLAFTFDRRQFRVHYPFEVRLEDPFVPSLSISTAHRDRIEAEIDLSSAYPGRDMKRISVYPWLNTDLTIAPRDLRVDMSSGIGCFNLTYTTLPKTASYRAVTVVMKLDEHLVRLRSVMEASLDLGTSTRGAALWINGVGEWSGAPTTIDGRRCRQVDGSQGMSFAMSPNVPTTGTTYVSVTYHDGRGTFGLQHGSYPDDPDVVRMEGTRAWKTKTFVMGEAAFKNHQNAESDFRLVLSDGSLAVSRVVVSKFVPEDGIVRSP